MRIGGWTRIWIVLSSILLITISYTAYNQAPTRREILSDWYTEIAEVLAEIQGGNNSPLNMRIMYFNKSEQDIHALLKKSAADTEFYATRIQSINSKYKAELSTLTKRQIMHWASALGFWLLSVFLIYLAGMILGWIWRGFQNSNPKDLA